MTILPKLENNNPKQQAIYDKVFEKMIAKLDIGLPPLQNNSQPIETPVVKHNIFKRTWQKITRYYDQK